VWIGGQAAWIDVLAGLGSNYATAARGFALRDTLTSLVAGYTFRSLATVGVSTCLMLGPAVARPVSCFNMPSTERLWSTSRQFYVVGEHANNEYAQPRRLIIKQPSGNVVYIFTYPRGCSVSWAPKANDLAISDDYASNMTRLFLLRVSSTPPQHPRVQLIQVDKLLRISAPGGGDLKHYGHVYVSATKWVGDSIAVAVYAYEEPPYPVLHPCYKYTYPSAFIKMPRSWCGPQPGFEYFSY